MKTVIAIAMILLTGEAQAALVWTQIGGQWLQSPTPEVLEEDRAGQGEETREPQDDAERGEDLGDERLVPEDALTE